MCRDCPLHLEDCNLLANLIGLTMKDFDVILRIDWLMKYYAKSDCVKKRISFSVPRGQSFEFQCNLMSDTFLTSHLVNIEAINEELTVSTIPIVRDFEEIFKDISGLPPRREIDFCIELVPGTLPISKAPYRMTPT